MAYSTDREMLEIVDSEDRVIGLATREEIHRRKLLHRAVHVFVFNRAGDIFVQRRSASKDRHPLKLDSSAAGHVDPGELYQTAASRELKEELGLNCYTEEVFKVAACDATDSEHVRLYKVLTDAQPIISAGEVSWGGFMKQQDLSSRMESDPNDFVPAFILLWREFLRKYR